MAYKTDDETAREFNPYFVDKKRFGFDFEGLYAAKKEDGTIGGQTIRPKAYVGDFLANYSASREEIDLETARDILREIDPELIDNLDEEGFNEFIDNLETIIW